VLRSVNFRTGFTPGSLFQIATNLSMGQSAESDAKSLSVANRVPSLDLRACSPEAYDLARLAESMTNVFVAVFIRRRPEPENFRRSCAVLTFAPQAVTVKRNVLVLRQIYRDSSDRKLHEKWWTFPLGGLSSRPMRWSGQRHNRRGSRLSARGNFHAVRQRCS
jgi:hypothetical protein